VATALHLTVRHVRRLKRHFEAGGVSRGMFASMPGSASIPARESITLTPSESAQTSSASRSPMLAATMSTS
jgi:hypothetical protein